MPFQAALTRLQLRLAESGRIPDPAIRWGIRRILAERLRDQALAGEPFKQGFISELGRSPVALLPERANAQHYEWPAAFFEAVLGPQLKYSSAYFPPGVTGLVEAEEAMLALTCRRAGIEDGMQVLDLGCGWGSLSLWVATRHPACRVLAVSNSKSQREHVLARCAGLGLDNVEVVTADMNAFDTGRRFDRVVSIEMFEHMRNWGLLLERVARWLAPGGRLFLHFFAHRSWAYPFEDAGASDWMARHFFSGGMMPSADLLSHFEGDLQVEEGWDLPGTHYQQTCEAWLQRQDRAREALRPVLSEVVGPREADRAHQRWRLFFLACAEQFGLDGGEQWRVCHRRLAPVAAGGS
jgi:cyclopropane-fatty-acyl-phospholipid synthase